MNRERWVDHVRTHPDGVMSSIGPGGAPQAAYLVITATDRGELVLDARSESRKIANVRRDPRVAVVIGGADGTTLQCEGVADLPEGPDRERCAAAYTSTFPQFAGSLVDDEIVLVRIRLTWGRISDYRSGTAASEPLDLDG